MSNPKSSDIFDREREITDLFKTQDIVSAANFLCDFVKDFDNTRERKKDCISFCNRASIIINYEKRRKFGSFKEFQDMVTELLYDMMDVLDEVVSAMTHSSRAA